MPMHRHPTFVSCVLALDAESHADGTITLHRCFEYLSVPGFPSIHRGFVALIEVTGGRGRSKIDFRLIDAAEERAPVTHWSIDVNFLDPTGRGIGVFTMKDLRFDHPGGYRLQAWHGEDLVLNKRLDVIVAPSAGPGTR